MEFSKEILKGNIDTLILLILNKKDCYGYQIAKDVRNKSDCEFELKEGTMYPTLKRLENKGYIESYWGDESTGGRRKYYKITIEGLKMLDYKKKRMVCIKKNNGIIFKRG